MLSREPTYPRVDLPLVGAVLSARPVHTPSVAVYPLRLPDAIFLSLIGSGPECWLLVRRPILKPQRVFSPRPVSSALSVGLPAPSVASGEESGLPGLASGRPPATSSPAVRKVSMSVFLSQVLLSPCCFTAPAGRVGVAGPYGARQGPGGTPTILSGAPRLAILLHANTAPQDRSVAASLR